MWIKHCDCPSLAGLTRTLDQCAAMGGSTNLPREGWVWPVEAEEERETERERESGREREGGREGGRERDTQRDRETTERRQTDRGREAETERFRVTKLEPCCSHQ